MLELGTGAGAGVAVRDLLQVAHGCRLHMVTCTWFQVAHGCMNKVAGFRATCL